jgi:hypothetical protein
MAIRCRQNRRRRRVARRSADILRGGRILAVTVPNMAALDKTDEGDAVAAKVMGTDDTQNKAAIDRESLREVLGGELIRELVLK